MPDVLFFSREKKKAVNRGKPLSCLDRMLFEKVKNLREVIFPEVLFFSIGP